MSQSEALEEVKADGWRYGFANLWGKESRLLWSKYRWLWTAIIWLLLIDGLLAPSLFGFVSSKAAPFSNGMLALIDFLLLFPPVGAIVQVQGKIIDERLSGTAAWILSKPVSRTAFVLSKCALLPGMLLFALVLPSAVGFGEVFLFSGQAPSIQVMLLTLGITGAHLLAYYCLTLVMQTFIKNRTAVIGSLLVIFVLELSGGTLNLVSHLILSGSPLLPALLALSLAVAAIFFLVIAIVQFAREEF